MQFNIIINFSVGMVIFLATSVKAPPDPDPWKANENFETLLEAVEDEPCTRLYGKYHVGNKVRDRAFDAANKNCRELFKLFKSSPLSEQEQCLDAMGPAQCETGALFAGDKYRCTARIPGNAWGSIKVSLYYCVYDAWVLRSEQTESLPNGPQNAGNAQLTRNISGSRSPPPAPAADRLESPSRVSCHEGRQRVPAKQKSRFHVSFRGLTRRLPHSKDKDRPLE